ncbi:diphosphoinositol polyphosphate phosphohydrolase 1 isoform X1 [Ictalurus punctatus]|uniref:diphosphoinositol-polyphosphate diphosphatase n=1 Tax=Ictalurus punctatus TaxID=7998 RepID=A0A2D0RXU0_ICTPU|nr:diphosphoinositol polyphosphate phosphohydrolase 1 isoform X1 [Ictalurus punctatus]
MMKLKSNQTRTYDGDGYKKRAACLCFRSETEEEVLLVSSSRHPDKWIVPGGGMEPDEEPNVAAVREVCEEAGVKGTLGRLVGIFENLFSTIKPQTPMEESSWIFVGGTRVMFTSGLAYRNTSCLQHFISLDSVFQNANQDRKHRTYVYVLIVKEVLEDWEDSLNIGRKREWFKIDDAIQVLQCHKPVQATYFEALQESCLTSNGTPLVATIAEDLSPSYNISQSSVSDIR